MPTKDGKTILGDGKMAQGAEFEFLYPMLKNKNKTRNPGMDVCFCNSSVGVPRQADPGSQPNQNNEFWVQWEVLSPTVSIVKSDRVVYQHSWIHTDVYGHTCIDIHTKKKKTTLVKGCIAKWI